MDKEIIKRNFSRSAKCYDKHASLQNLFASKLIAKTGSHAFKKILDLGCGTGNYTRLLRERFPSAEIKALDISGEMIKFARSKLHDKEITFVIEDAEKTGLNEDFDLITSNASFQWFENLDLALAKYRALLKTNGVILFSTFGPLTLCELNTSLNELFNGNISISSRGFVDKERLARILEKHFGKISVEEEVIKEKYISLWELLNKIKYTGARGMGISAAGIRRREITKLEEIYKRKFGNQEATYQVFYCRAVK